MVALYVLLYLYGFFLGFLAYSSAKQAWFRLKIGVRVLLIPAFLFFGLIDVVFNITAGTLLFLEVPRDLTFSQRCSRHLCDAGWRGKVANAFAVPLNAIDPNHIR